MHYQLSSTGIGIALMFSDVQERGRFLELTKAIAPSELWLFTRLGSAFGLILFGAASRVFTEILDKNPDSSDLTSTEKIRLFMQQVPGPEAVRIGELCTRQLEVELDMRFPEDSGMRMFEGVLKSVRDRILGGTLSTYLDGHNPSTRELTGLVLYSLGLEAPSDPLEARREILR